MATINSDLNPIEIYGRLGKWNYMELVNNVTTKQIYRKQLKLPSRIWTGWSKEKNVKMSIDNRLLVAIEKKGLYIKK